MQSRITFDTQLKITLKVMFNLDICIISRNTKKAEDNITSLEKDIEENDANIKRLEVGISKLVIITFT